MATANACKTRAAGAARPTRDRDESGSGKAATAFRVKHITRAISPLHPQASSILPKRVHCHHLICLDSRVYSHCSARLTRVTPRPPRRPRRAPRPQPRPPRDPAHPHSGIGRLHAHSHIAQSKHEMQRPWRMGRAPRQPSRHATRRGAATCRCAVHVPGAAAGRSLCTLTGSPSRHGSRDATLRLATAMSVLRSGFHAKAMWRSHPVASGT